MRKSFLDETKIDFKSDAISKSTKFQILFDLKKDISFTQIALKNDVGVDTVIDVFNKYVSIPKMSFPETICIDEFKNLRSAKGKYAFLVLDPINHKVIEVLESRQAEDIKDYFYSLGNEERNNVKYVVSDMNEVYRYIIKKYFPNATYVVDCFHYLRYVEDAFNKVRIRIQKKYKTDDARYKMLKTYWKILSNYVVTLESNELMNYISGNKTNIDDIINDSLSIDSELETAYDFLQNFLESVKKLKYEEANEYMDKWIEQLRTTQIPEFNALYKMFRNWKKEIVNSFIRFSDNIISLQKIKNIHKGCLNQIVVASMGFEPINASVKGL